ncbi:MAG: hypothetical protein EOO09_12900 [Chitinophagaceae bacterium]|nr:MAG: hypothetical protein EOO09_12900 [Chitinophagaceae bacterium]
MFEIQDVKEGRYLAVFCKDFAYNYSHSNELLFLFTIRDSGIVASRFLGDTYFITPRMFSDVNRNGHLEFLKFAPLLDSIYRYEIMDSGFVRMGDQYMEVDCPDGRREIFQVKSVSGGWKR